MNYIVRSLQKSDIQQAASLDRRWFGNNGITNSELEAFVTKSPNMCLAIESDNNLVGFCTWQILEEVLPSDYLGHLPFKGKVLFIQQFTTSTNYKIEKNETDKVLLEAVESSAQEIGCNEVWEALSIDHPFRKENNEAFDAYGFYESRGYIADKDKTLIWNPDSKTIISCYLFRKIVSC